ncbi:hypothetical protein L483_17010 [Pseudomonas putida H8234]|nr:hypothetical protein L483_17010 [Pseudomonas putida H8234]
MKDCFYLRAREPLAQTPSRILDRLLHWAEVRQDQTFVAKRSSEGNWLRLSYGEMLDRVRAIAANLLDYSLGPERPLLILSGNDLEHLQLTLAAYYIGVPVCPVSPAYSIVAKEFSKLRHILKLTSPGLVFASDGELYAKAITEEVPIVAADRKLTQ